MLDTNRLVQPVAQTYASITHGSYSAAVVAGQFPPRLVQSVNFLSDCIVSATNIGGPRCPTQIGWCSRLHKTYTSINHGSYSAAVSAGQFPPRLAQPVNFLNDCIVNATIGGQRCPTQIGWCSRLLKPTLFRGCFSRSIPPAAGSASQFPQRLHSKCYNKSTGAAGCSNLHH